MASIKFENIKKIYEPDNVVVKDFSLNIEDGEFVVLVGPSGCGKSTLLRMIAGLETPTEGNILIDDQIVNTIAPKDRNVAMVFQNYALYPHMSVFDNLAFGLRLRKFNKVEIRERVHKAAEILKITSLLGRKPKQLSGGERQRIALGRAIVRDPSVFLFDEPLSNLDAKLRVHMRAEIKKLHQQLKTTMVYVTHDQVEAMTIGDRIIILNDGIIQQIGTPLNVYKNPANIFVAGFIGSPPMNFITGEISNNVFSFDNLNMKLTKAMVHESDKGTKKMVVGIRPEDISFSKKGLDYKLIFEEQLGNESLIYIKVGDQNLVVRVAQDNPGPHNENNKISLNMLKACFFDPKIGNRINIINTD
ncbi:sn-glycerol-3-phosphate ABC transporter ATP-binding protein UgpC [bacterium]|nr:sn-glycerol-3-phosphate ABC transporter ATP-binding protein UgpC [bacterium]